MSSVAACNNLCNNHLKFCKEQEMVDKKCDTSNTQQFTKQTEHNSYLIWSFIIHLCDRTVMICYLIWPCDIAARITYLISHSSSLRYNTVIKGYFRLGV